MPYFDQDDPLGTDFSGTDDIDNNLTPVSGRLMLAQAVARRWLTEPGSLFYDPEYGYGLKRLLNASIDSTGAIAAGLSAEALKDERVETCVVDVVLEGEDLAISGRLTDLTGPFTLTLTLSADNPLTLEVLDSP